VLTEPSDELMRRFACVEDVVILDRDPFAGKGSQSVGQTFGDLDRLEAGTGGRGPGVLTGRRPAENPRRMSVRLV
jgi:hypothetical protein